jgi:hypothetical protein
VKITDSVKVTCSYDLYVVNKSNLHSKTLWIVTHNRESINPMDAETGTRRKNVINALNRNRIDCPCYKSDEKRKNNPIKIQFMSSIPVFFVFTPWSLAGGNQLLGGAGYFRLLPLEWRQGTSITTYQTTRSHDAEYHHPNQQHREGLKSRIAALTFLLSCICDGARSV